MLKSDYTPVCHLSKVIISGLDKGEVDVEVPYNSCKSSRQKEKSTYKSVIRLGKTGGVYKSTWETCKSTSPEIL